MADPDPRTPLFNARHSLAMERLHSHSHALDVPRDEELHSVAHRPHVSQVATGPRGVTHATLQQVHAMAEASHADNASPTTKGNKANIGKNNIGNISSNINGNGNGSGNNGANAAAGNNAGRKGKSHAEERGKGKGKGGSAITVTGLPTIPVKDLGMAPKPFPKTARQTMSAARERDARQRDDALLRTMPASARHLAATGPAALNNAGAVRPGVHLSSKAIAESRLPDPIQRLVDLELLGGPQPVESRFNCTPRGTPIGPVVSVHRPRALAGVGTAGGGGSPRKRKDRNNNNNTTTNNVNNNNNNNNMTAQPPRTPNSMRGQSPRLSRTGAPLDPIPPRSGGGSYEEPAAVGIHGSRPNSADASALKRPPATGGAGGSRPGSSSRPGSRPASRQSSAPSVPSVPSVPGGGGAGDGLGSRPGSRPGSRSGSRPGSRPGSAATGGVIVPGGASSASAASMSRPGSAQEMRQAVIDRAAKGGAPPRVPTVGGDAAPPPQPMSSSRYREERIDPLTGRSLPPLDSDGEEEFPTFLPLTSFDVYDGEGRTTPPVNRIDYVNGEMDIRSDRDGGSKVALAVSKFYTDSGSILKPCLVLGYEENRKQYLIQWQDTGTRKLVSRFNLRFQGEDHDLYRERVELADRLRDEGERLLRTEYFVRDLPADAVAEIPEAQRRRILALSGYSSLSRSAADHFVPLVDEADALYVHGQKLASFWHLVRDEDLRRQYEELRFALPEEKPSAAPRFGKVQIPDPHFEERLALVQEASLYNSAEMISCIQGIWHECLEAREVQLFVSDFDTPAPATLERFQAVQNTQRVRAAQVLRQEFHATIGKQINAHRYAFMERKSRVTLLPGRALAREQANRQRLESLLMLTAQMMQDTLRVLLTDGLLAFTEIIAGSAPIESPLHSEEQRSLITPCDETERLLFGERQVPAAGHNAIKGADPTAPLYCRVKHDYTFRSPRSRVNSLGRAPSTHRKPLFRVSLTIDDASRRVLFRPPLVDFVEACTMVFDDMLTVPFEMPKIDATVKNNFAFDALYLEIVRPNERFVMRARERVEAAIEESCLAPEELVEDLSSYEFLLDMFRRREDYLADFASREPGFAEMKREIYKHLDGATEIEASVPDTISLGMFVVDVSALKYSLMEMSRTLARDIQTLLWKSAKADSDEINGTFEQIAAHLRKVPQTPEEFGEMQEYQSQLIQRIDTLRTKTSVMLDKYELLERFQFEVPREEVEAKWKAYGWPKQVEVGVGRSQNRMDKAESIFRSDLTAKKKEFEARISKLEFEIKRVSRFVDITQASEYKAAVGKLQNEFAECEATAARYNEYETLFGHDTTHYPEIQEAKAKLDPYVQIWGIAADWEMWSSEWKYGEFLKLEPETITRQITNTLKQLTKLKQVFAEAPEPLSVAVKVRSDLEDFKVHLPLIQALRGPGLRDRHWVEMAKITGFYFKPDYELTLTSLLERYDFSPFMGPIQQISAVAEREYSLEMSLDRMLHEWGTVVFDLVPYKSTGTTVLRAPDDIATLIEDHMVKVATMRGSPFIAPFLPRLNKWEGRLHRISDVLEEWLLCQHQWLYLEPIFRSADIKRQLPLEARRFGEVDFKWRAIMSMAARNPKVLAVTTQDSLLDQFKDCNRLLELIFKGLNEYLDAKRTAFARFYFLSNDEMLEILSQSTDPASVQPHLHKCFAGIHRLDFVQVEEDDLPSAPAGDTTAAAATAAATDADGAARGDDDANNADANTNAGPENNNGNNEADNDHADGGGSERSATSRSARNTATNKSGPNATENNNTAGANTATATANNAAGDAAGDAATDEPKRPDVKAMAMISEENESVRFVTPIFPADKKVEEWLSEVETGMRAAIESLINEGLSRYSTVPREQWISQWPGQIVLAGTQVIWTQAVEKAIATFGVAGLKQVHQRLVQQLSNLTEMVRGNLPARMRITLGALAVQDVHARDVVERLIERNCHDVDSFDWQSQLRFYWDQASTHLHVRQIKAVIPYGYEYWGNTSRLVVTPLTDRCYMTLTSAMSVQLGGAPTGPAGTGKTETVKDLAKTTGTQCMVFNCSDGLDYIAMGKFFKGLCFTGAWSCFDEFNRIELEVLSVIAQQILTIQKAVQAGADRLQFEGTDVRLNRGVAIFITMNPGYAGRTELPDNLKILFRPVAMMIPDYSLIAEIVLFSEGFSETRSLAKKLVNLNRLASQQLSSQDHYDFGMRNVKAVLTRAGVLKREDPTGDEARIILRALQECNLPKFLAEDIPLFMGIIQDLFPGSNLKIAEDEVLRERLGRQLAEDGLQSFDSFVAKILQLNETMKVRHGCMLVGRTGSGKTASYTALARALTSLAGPAPGSGGGTAPAVAGGGVGAANSNSAYRPVLTYVMNPKSVTYGQLYGQFDMVSHEWTDGILASIVRHVASPQTEEEERARKWIVFDGPVDSVWIESMNTVLDDNKMLCLISGERVSLPSSANIVFEVDGLSEASPATVSRCGMVFMEPRGLGWKPLFQSWLAALPGKVKVSVGSRAHLDDLFTLIVPEAMQYVLSQGKSVIAVGEVNLIRSLLNLFDALLEPYRDRGTAEDEALLQAVAAATAQGGAGAKQKPPPPTPSAGDSPALGAPDGASSPGGSGGGGGAAASTPAQQQKGLPSSMETANEILEGFFYLSLVWSIGAVLDTDDQRDKFDKFLRRKMALNDADVQFGEEGTVYDYAFDPLKREFKRWMATVDPYQVPHEAPFHQIIVPTVHSVRTRYFLALLTSAMKPTLLIGPSGVGKTVTIADFLEVLATDGPAAAFPNISGSGADGGGLGGGGADRDGGVSSIGGAVTYTPLSMSFSARTTAAATQDMLDARMTKRRRGYFGPRSGTRLVVFVDDINMPAREKYGAQPPVELLRQLVDQGGWYDRKARTLRNVLDTLLIGAMGPPGGGRHVLSERFTRHFNVIACPEPDRDSMRLMFGTILKEHTNEHAQEIRALTEATVDATLQVYQIITSQLLPTPSKSHYTYNMRDLAKVFQGMLMVDSGALENPHGAAASADGGTTGHSGSSAVVQYLRLWNHECRRVFEDRLTNDRDRAWFREIMVTVMSEHFIRRERAVICSAEDVADPEESIVFGDFATGTGRSGGTVVGVGQPPYAEIHDVGAAMEEVSAFLDVYNEEGRSQLNLVMFHDALAHVARISRILRQERGNALLIGLGGSGRKSLTRLAAAMRGFEVFEIELHKNYSVNDWKDDLREVLRSAGLEGNDVVFLFDDTQIVKVEFLEDINNLLNYGDVPHLWRPEDLEAVQNAMRPVAHAQGLPETVESLFKLFVDRCRAGLHLVLCMSPAGDAFRERIRMFPSLVGCCTIDWFDAWPEDALHSVALRFLEDVDLESDLARKKIARAFLHFHRTATEASRVFHQQERRMVYVTPTSYISLLRTFGHVLGSLRKTVGDSASRTSSGLSKLLETAVLIEEMGEELVTLTASLKVSTKETEELMAKIAVDQRVADQSRAEVEAEEVVAAKQTQETKEIAAEAQESYDLAIPALEAALGALKSLNKGDITEVKSMVKPPRGVVLVMEAVCIMREVQPKKRKDDGTGKRHHRAAGGASSSSTSGADGYDYWPVAKQMLGQNGFMNSLLNFDRDNIPERVIAKIAPYIENPEFVPEHVAKSSRACKCLCIWVRALYDYHHAYQNLLPKKALLEKVKKELEDRMADLEAKRARLRDIQAHITSMKEQYDAAVAKKQHLIQTVSDCTTRMARAKKLSGALVDEKIRWSRTVEELNAKRLNLLGDSIISAGVITYLGPFTHAYRQRLTREWAELVGSLKIKYRDPSEAAQAAGDTDFRVADALSDPLTVRRWITHGLPRDGTSIDNAAMIFRSPRFPLLIDPQGQAAAWIKNEERNNGLVVRGKDSDDTLRILETAIENGLPMLLENVGEELDKALEPLLEKQTFREGGRTMIRMGEATFEFHPDFRFYITTKLPNPHYLPEVSTKVTLINFTIGREGLEDQLLALVVQSEKPLLESMRNSAMNDIAEGQVQLKAFEERILDMLSSSTGNLLDDEALIDVLSDSKTTSDEVETKVQQAETTEKEINEARNDYRPVANRCAVLYFAVADLHRIDPMYQFSLDWFLDLFSKGIRKHSLAAASADGSSGDGAATGAGGRGGRGGGEVEDIGAHLLKLERSFLHLLYVSVSRSLFAEHKLLFSLLLTVRIEMDQRRVDPGEYRYFLTGDLSVGESHDLANPGEGWLPDRAWKDIAGLSRHHAAFFGLDRDVMFAVKHWRSYFESPHAAEPLPGDWQDRLTQFQRLVVTRCVRPDRVENAVRAYVSDNLGPDYVDPPANDLYEIWKDLTSPTVPLVFLLSPGSYPVEEIRRLAEKVGMSNRLKYVSLGQGQGKRSQAMIEEAIERGSWVLLQNCHLARSWMPTLEKIVSQIPPDRVHHEFRLFLTSLPTPHFPVSILQRSAKVTSQQPAGIRANMIRSLTSYPSESFPVRNPEEEGGGGGGDVSGMKPAGGVGASAGVGGPLAEAHARLLFNLAALHAVVQERRKFGPLGWNTSYDFNESDLHISQLHLAQFINGTASGIAGDSGGGGGGADGKGGAKAVGGGTTGAVGAAGKLGGDGGAAKSIPFPALKFVTGFIDYGGRVTDSFDQRTLDTLVDEFYNDRVLSAGQYLSVDGVYTTPVACDKASMIEHIRSFPAVDPPSIFGMHENADMTCAAAQTQRFVDGLLLVQGSAATGAPSSGGGSGGGNGGGANNGGMGGAGGSSVGLDGGDDKNPNDGAAGGGTGSVSLTSAGGGMASSSPSSSSTAMLGGGAAGGGGANNDDDDDLDADPAADAADRTNAQLAAMVRKSPDEVVMEIAAEILKKIPEPFSLEAVERAHPLMTSSSYNTVLLQECGRYNRLTDAVRESCRLLHRAIRGEIVMSEAQEKVYDAIYNGHIPDAWRALSFESEKGLGPWVTDLQRRIKFLEGWNDNGAPPVFWLSGFFFPQAFLTGTLQNYARKHGVALDALKWRFHVIDRPEAELTSPPESGAYVRGLFIEGARWDPARSTIIEPRPRELLAELPVMWFEPYVPAPAGGENDAGDPMGAKGGGGGGKGSSTAIGMYECPVYKTLKREGALSTTGISANYLITVTLPSDKPAAHWIKRGVAIVTSTND